MNSSIMSHRNIVMALVTLSSRDDTHDEHDLFWNKHEDFIYLHPQPLPKHSF